MSDVNWTARFTGMALTDSPSSAYLHILAQRQGGAAGGDS